ncbi:MAG: oxygenase MpaB family protein [Candidatus Promineifilaceae bacterium]|nr:oxygenase MpaB family protein [Candidatus Promineifilaceae bacterium]
MQPVSQLLDAGRHAGDPLADQTIQAIASGQDIGLVNQVMRTLVENDDFPTAELPSPVMDYMERSSLLPSWANLEQMQHGGQLFVRYGPEIVLMLFGASLPLLYAAHPGCEVLLATRQMTHNVHRRIIETGQFVIDVTEPRAWEPAGRGRLTSQKVRLMHAAIRHYLTKDQRWREHWRADWGTPICQEDLLGTMLTFSVTIIQKLELSRITLSQAEKESYLHLWKVVGYLLGVDEGRMPADYEEAEALLALWMQRNHRPNDTSRRLMKAMIDFWYLRVPGRRFDRVTSGWCRLWIGDELADAMGVPPFNWTRHLLNAQIRLWQAKDRLGDRSAPFQSLTRFWTRGLMQALMMVERDGQRPDFRIPEQLQAKWGLARPQT